MQFPNEVQACLIYDDRIGGLEDTVRTFMRVEEARSGAKFNVPEFNPGKFYRLFGGDELMVTFEYLDNPPNMEVFAQPLASPVTGMLCPEIRQRLTRSKSHILINVSHGVLGGVANDPGIATMLQQLGVQEGQSLPQFRRRLELLALISRIVSDHAAPLVVHWTQSNQLIPGEMFETYATGDAPGPLHVHPYIFGGGRGADGKTEAGILTFGARHFIGREVTIEPNVLPWAANFETILAFLRVATAPNGYIIPDNDTFGPEDGSLSYRVLHRENEGGEVPLYELEPLMYREFGFQSSDYVPRERVFDDRMPPADLMPPDQETKQELANEWREKRAMAEGIGARFEVRARGGDGAPPPSGPAAPQGGPGFGRRVVFGRKQASG